MGLTRPAVLADYGASARRSGPDGVMEAFGEALVVEPYLATIMGAQLVARAGSAEQKRAILPPSSKQDEARLRAHGKERG